MVFPLEIVLAQDFHVSISRTRPDGETLLEGQETLTVLSCREALPAFADLAHETRNTRRISAE
jgi:hypothetical protein